MFGQMSFQKKATASDYIQLDICGLTAKEAAEKYKTYAPLPMILHGDWTKKGQSENRLKERLPAYLEIVSALKSEGDVLGFTLHPPTKKTMTKEMMMACVKTLSRVVPVFVENRSHKRYLVSTPSEVIAFSRNDLMTLDLPQLYIACGYDAKCLYETLDQLNWENIRECHVANIKRDGRRTYVARKIDDGELDYEKLLPYLAWPPYLTLEILGREHVFNEQANSLKAQLQAFTLEKERRR